LLSTASRRGWAPAAGDATIIEKHMQPMNRALIDALAVSSW
jgi:hypothetical protein